MTGGAGFNPNERDSMTTKTTERAAYTMQPSQLGNYHADIIAPNGGIACVVYDAYWHEPEFSGMATASLILDALNESLNRKATP